MYSLNSVESHDSHHDLLLIYKNIENLRPLIITFIEFSLNFHRQTTSFIVISIEAGILLRGNEISYIFDYVFLNTRKHKQCSQSVKYCCFRFHGLLVLTNKLALLLTQAASLGKGTVWMTWGLNGVQGRLLHCSLGRSPPARPGHKAAAAGRLGARGAV